MTTIVNFGATRDSELQGRSSSATGGEIKSPGNSHLSLKNPTVQAIELRVLRGNVIIRYTCSLFLIIRKQQSSIAIIPPK